jgi:hypothetical protein
LVGLRKSEQISHINFYEVIKLAQIKLLPQNNKEFNDNDDKRVADTETI